MFQGRLGLMSIVAVALCAAGPASAQPQDRQMGGIGITVFDDIGYRGENATFRSDQPDLGAARFGNRISSFQVAPGEVWEVCEGANYRPPCQVFSGNEPDLRRRSWSDRITSLRRVRGGRGGGGIFPPNPPGRSRLVLYRDERFRGQAVPLNGPTPSLGSFNDKAESLRIESGTWEVCEDINYGKCRTVTPDMPNLDGLGLSKRVSSARPSLATESANQRSQQGGREVREERHDSVPPFLPTSLFRKFRRGYFSFTVSSPSALSFTFSAGTSIVLNAVHRAMTRAALA